MLTRASIFMPFLLFSLLFSTPTFAKGGVVMNFNEVDISTMVKFISDLTGKNFVMDDRVKGKISVFSPTKLSADEAFDLFTSVLELKGFTIIESVKIYKVVPIGAARQSGTRLVTGDHGPVNESYVARIIPLENISSQEAVTFLQPVVSKDGYISGFGPANMLLVVDSSLNIDKLMSILKVIDSDQRKKGAEIVFLRNASADSVANLIRQWSASRSGRTGQQGAQGGGDIVVPDPRLNAVLLFGRDGEKEDIKRMISMVDVETPQTSGKVNVYYLENADATEVAKVLETVVKGPAAAQQPNAAAAAFDGGKITITPDKATNSLVVMASPADYQNLVQVIQKLDRRRRQVFVQALIAEVSLDKLRDLGVQWGAFGAGSQGAVNGVGLYDPNNTLASLLSLLSSAGFSGQNVFSISRSVNLGAILHALETNSGLNVLSTPNILTSDNKEAEIFVGENVPFLTQSNLSATGLSQQSIERKDTGITLRLTPQITEGEYIKLDLYQEISAIKDTVTIGAGSTDRTTTKRSAKTSVLVKNSETIVIGGLIQNQDQDVENKVPLLGDIPLLGYLFKFKTVKHTKTNLIILLTPRIVKDASDLAAVSGQQKVNFSDAARSDAPLDFTDPKILETISKKQEPPKDNAPAPSETAPTNVTPKDKSASTEASSK